MDAHPPSVFDQIVSAAIARAGSNSALARALRVDVSTVGRWAKGCVPRGAQVRAIERYLADHPATEPRPTSEP